MSDRLSEYMSDGMPNRMSEFVSDTLIIECQNIGLDRMSEYKLDIMIRMSEYLSDSMSEYMLDRMPKECQNICEIECQKMSGRMPKRMRE